MITIIPAFFFDSLFVVYVELKTLEKKVVAVVSESSCIGQVYYLFFYCFVCNIYAIDVLEQDE